MRHPQRVALSRSSHPRAQLGPGLCKGAGGRPGAGWGPGWGQRLRTAGAPLRGRSALRDLRGTARASEGPLGPQRCGHPRGELGRGREEEEEAAAAAGGSGMRSARQPSAPGRPGSAAGEGSGTAGSVRSACLPARERARARRARKRPEVEVGRRCSF